MESKKLAPKQRHFRTLRHVCEGARTRPKLPKKTSRMQLVLLKAGPAKDRAVCSLRALPVPAPHISLGWRQGSAGPRRFSGDTPRANRLHQTNSTKMGAERVASPHMLADIRARPNTPGTQLPERILPVFRPLPRDSALWVSCECGKPKRRVISLDS